MYTVTFYSFKGGVGRSMALVNVGVELARRGRRVLLVDFDLEAPGLGTFDLPRPKKPSKGLVEFISDYIATATSPDVREYLYEVPTARENGGRLWLMPAGIQDESYSQRFNAIDWQELYAERDGYLLIEDLKAQWLDTLAPDYVLVDSRTGHTDISGICTRQLPNAVVLMFFPNEQNLSGLKKVVSDIRRESTAGTRRSITLHFVSSNVPDLDDEEEILGRINKRFREALTYDEATSTIHHYGSLSLVNQTVFTLERPKSRLTQEYRQLTDAIARENISDRDGALALIENISRGSLQAGETMHGVPIEERLNQLFEAHQSDGELLFRLASVSARLSRIEQAITFLNAAVDAGYDSPSAYALRAELLHGTGDVGGALDDVLRVLRSRQASYLELVSSVRLLREFSEAHLKDLATAQAVQSLEPGNQLLVVKELMWKRAGLQAASEIAEPLTVRKDLLPGQLREARRIIVQCKIGNRQFSDAVKLAKGFLEHSEPTSRRELLFDIAAAEWGHAGSPAKESFSNFVDAADDGKTGSPQLEHAQQMALACLALEKRTAARAQIKIAESLVRANPAPAFSYWQYLFVSPSQLQDDLRSLHRAINGSADSPMFLNASPEARSR